jgi:hypothetical protein
MSDQPGALASYAGCGAGLAQILTRKSGCDQVNGFREVLYIANIPLVRDIRKMRLEDGDGRFPNLGKERSLMAASL